MSKIKLAFALCLICAATNSTIAATEPQHRRSKIVHLRIKIVDRQPIVEGKLNGLGIALLIDSASEVNTITPQAIEGIGLPVTVDTYRGVSIDGPIGGVITQPAQLALPDEAPSKQSFVVVGKSELTSGSLSLSGLMGDGFQSGVLELALSRGRIRICDGVRCQRDWSRRVQGPQRIEVEFQKTSRSGLPTFSASVGGRLVSAVLDTGSTCSIVRDTRLQDSSGRDVDGVGTRILGSQALSPTSRFIISGPIVIGDRTLRSTPVRAIRLPKDSPDLILGMDFLNRFDVIMNMSLRKIALGPRPSNTSRAGCRTDWVVQADHQSSTVPSIARIQEAESDAADGDRHMKQLAFQKALSAYSSAISADSSQPIYFIHSALAKMASGDEDGYLRSLKSAETLLPHSPAIAMLLAIALANQGKRAQSTEYINRAIAQFPRSADMRLEAANLLYENGRQTRAAREFRIWADSRPLDHRICSADNPVVATMRAKSGYHC